MEPIPNLNTLRTLYLILIHANLKKGGDDPSQKPPLYPSLIHGGRHPPPPPGGWLTLLLLPSIALRSLRSASCHFTQLS